MGEKSEIPAILDSKSGKNALIAESKTIQGSIKKKGGGQIKRSKNASRKRIKKKIKQGQKNKSVKNKAAKDKIAAK